MRTIPVFNCLNSRGPAIVLLNNQLGWKEIGCRSIPSVEEVNQAIKARSLCVCYSPSKKIYPDLPQREFFKHKLSQRSSLSHLIPCNLLIQTLRDGPPIESRLGTALVMDSFMGLQGQIWVFSSGFKVFYKLHSGANKYKKRLGAGPKGNKGTRYWLFCGFPGD